MELVVLLVAGGILGLALLVTWLVVWLPAARRSRRLRVVASEHGLLATDGTAGLPALPLRLFARGTSQEIERTLHGRLDGRPCRVLDLVYVRETPGLDWSWEELALVAEALRRWSRLATRRRLTCAVVELPGAAWPELHVDARGEAATRDAAQLTARPIRLESDEFNRVFHVTGTDARFASHLLDARMMSFLLKMCRSHDVLVAGRFLVVVAAPTPPERWPDLQRLANLAADRIPDVTFSVFGGARPAAPARPHPDGG